MRLDDPEQIKKLKFHEKWQLAEAGFIEHPTEDDLDREIRSRTVDDWFRIMSDKRHEHLSVPVLREYAKSFRLQFPKEIKHAREKRIRLQKILSLTTDYATALNISCSLHISEDQWRELYPLLDPVRSNILPQICANSVLCRARSVLSWRLS